MSAFVFRFILCNLMIFVFIGIVSAIKAILKNRISRRVQYHLWFPMFAALAAPFIPIRPKGFLRHLSLPDISRFSPGPKVDTAAKSSISDIPFHQIQDFALSADQKAPFVLGFLLLFLWFAGIAVMIVLTVNAQIRLGRLKRSASPLDNQEIHALYQNCREEIPLHRKIPLYTTPFLQSPIASGLWKPHIYLPLHLTADFSLTDIRYMLLHELTHVKYNDNLWNIPMNLFSIVYWYHPGVRYALKVMRDDRELACDASVLQILPENEHMDYGNTLLNFAEKISVSPHPFVTEMGGRPSQIRKRIVTIASYRPLSFKMKRTGIIACTLTVAILLGCLPVFPAFAAREESYQFPDNKQEIAYLDLESFFHGFDGSFVLYDSASDSWSIYNPEYASMRISPDSTWKIYDALLGLESGIITPSHSQLQWDQTDYPFESWNRDQNLNSAMANSVNWYFQAIDRQLGASYVKDYVQKIGYGNEDISGEFPAYWMESSLKISPLEQVELLKSLYHNEFAFSKENIETVKDAIKLASSSSGSLYGKTGTGQVEGKTINGWFIGCVESERDTCFFAVNIQGSDDALGTTASEIALSILSKLQLWE